jgi:hypothetical protein
MPLHTFLHTLLNVLVQIANKFFFINRAWLNQNSMSIKTSLTKLTINFNLT